MISVKNKARAIRVISGLLLSLAAATAWAQASVTTAATLCPASTREITGTNLVANSDFSDTALSPGNGGGVALATTNTEPANNRVAYVTGTLVVTTGAPDLNQKPFPGDAPRSVAATDNWLLANGNTIATPANGIWWSQRVSGLVSGLTYTFVVYASSPTDGAQGGVLPALALTVTQTSAVTKALGSIVTDTAAADVWKIYQTTFLASQTTATLALKNTQSTNSTERRGLFAVAQPTLRLCGPAANVSVTQTNGVTAIEYGDTTTYSITFSNSGPGAADGSVVSDTPGTGLTCQSVSCTSAIGGASCPPTGAAAGELSIGNLVPPGTGVTLPTFPANSTVTLDVTCTVG